MVLHMHSYFGCNKTWQQSRLTYNSESCFLCLIHVYPQGLLLMGIFGNMTVFLGSSSRLLCYLTYHLFSFFPPSHPSPPLLVFLLPALLAFPFIYLVSGVGEFLVHYGLFLEWGVGLGRCVWVKAIIQIQRKRLKSFPLDLLFGQFFLAFVRQTLRVIPSQKLFSTRD